MQNNGMHHNKAVSYHLASNCLAESVVQSFNGNEETDGGNSGDSVIKVPVALQHYPNATTDQSQAELIIVTH